jgi:hypothetical protein
MTASLPEPARRFVWPAEYYASATPRPFLPQWAAFGCGGASVLVLIVVFVGGLSLSRGGFADFMDLVIGLSVSEMKGMYAPEVTAETKKSLDAEIETMRENIRNERVAIPTLQPFLDTLRNATSDNKVTPEETSQLEEAARRVNGAAKPPAEKRPSPGPSQ